MSLFFYVCMVYRRKTNSPNSSGVSRISGFLRFLPGLSFAVKQCFEQETQKSYITLTLLEQNSQLKRDTKLFNH